MPRELVRADRNDRPCVLPSEDDVDADLPRHEERGVRRHVVFTIGEDPAVQDVRLSLSTRVRHQTVLPELGPEQLGDRNTVVAKDPGRNLEELHVDDIPLPFGEVDEILHVDVGLAPEVFEHLPGGNTPVDLDTARRRDDYPGRRGDSRLHGWLLGTVIKERPPSGKSQ